MANNDPQHIDVYQQAAELARIGNRAVRRAQEENRRLGIPNVYYRNGKLFAESPNGELIQTKWDAHNDGEGID